MRTEPSPPSLAFTPRERRLIERLRTPTDVQRFLNALPYNTEPPPGRATLRSFRGVVRHQTAHCLEAVLTAAVVLEQHGYPPLVLSFESVDELDHVLFVYRLPWPVGLGGAVPGPRAAWAQAGVPHDAGARTQLRRALCGLHWSDHRIRGGEPAGAGPLRLAALGAQRRGKVERVLLDYPHRRIHTPDHRIDQWRARYRGFMTRFPDRKPMFFKGQRAMERAPRTIPTRDRPRRHPARLGRTPKKLVEIELAVGAGDSVRCWACLSASSKRFKRASPRVFSSLTRLLE